MSVRTFSITTDIEDRMDLIELFHNMQLINPDAQFKIIEIKNHDGKIDCCISSNQGTLKYSQLINLAGDIIAAKRQNMKYYCHESVNCLFDIDYYDPRNISAESCCS
ncbi:MAG: hypothetical protein M5F18_06605 [Asgard group archaeon]|nr:hypothetical protein [Asgard group archaeon]